MRTIPKFVLAALFLLFASPGLTGDFAKGLEAYESADYQTAIAEWQADAIDGDADSQFGMGLLYANGLGVPMDDEQTLKWYGLAAAQGHPDAQFNLAVLYENGWGVPQSDSEAFRWYSLAADEGVVHAQIGVARMYLNGYGTARDEVQAYKWLSIASRLGDLDAESKRVELSAKVPAERVLEADRLAGEWIEGYQYLLAHE